MMILLTAVCLYFINPSSYEMLRIFLLSCILKQLVVSIANCTPAESMLWVDSDSFSEAIQSCAIKYFGAANMTGKCLAEKYDDLSDHCAECFGATVKCGADNCMRECIRDSGAPGCIACTEASGCQAALKVCTGIAQSPPNPKPGNASVTKSSNVCYGILLAVLGPLIFFG